MTGATSELRIRELSEPADLAAVDALLRGIWRPVPGSPPITAELLRVLSHSGGYVAGAYDENRLVGASVGILAAGNVLHSHVTGVGDGVRGKSVGFALKQHQRVWALDRGMAAITWTYDPLVRRNAHFNLAKLGARPETYLPDFYGPMHDGINAGEPSDRLLVRWELADPAVVAAGAGERVDVSATAALGVAVLDERGGAPAVEAADGEVQLIRVPADIESMRAGDPARAHEWRLAVREALGGRMAAGLTVAGFTKDGAYVLTP